jgi:alpha-1,3-mannosyltransferase
MQQIETYIAGERNYIKISGDTGPLVYPAAHVYIYRALYYLTSNGTNIFAAQCIFAGLYLATLWMVMQCYRAAKVPPYIFPILSLSKRMHSIFMLRLFNDCWAVFFLFAAIFFWQRKLWTLGTLTYSIGLGVKMILLLPLPAIGLVLWQGMGRDRAFYQAQSIGQVQVSSWCGTKAGDGSRLIMISIDSDCVPFHHGRTDKLLDKSVRLFTPVPLRVDCELALRERGHFPV